MHLEESGVKAGRSENLGWRGGELPVSFSTSDIVRRLEPIMMLSDVPVLVVCI